MGPEPAPEAGERLAQEAELAALHEAVVVTAMVLEPPELAKERLVGEAESEAEPLVSAGFAHEKSSDTKSEGRRKFMRERDMRYSSFVIISQRPAEIIQQGGAVYIGKSILGRVD
jgi:hypothetical protein